MSLSNDSLYQFIIHWTTVRLILNLRFIFKNCIQLHWIDQIILLIVTLNLYSEEWNKFNWKIFITCKLPLVLQMRKTHKETDNVSLTDEAII